MERLVVASFVANGHEFHLYSYSEIEGLPKGVVVRDALGRQGLLLPDIPGIENAALQVDLARRKAGIDPDATVRLSRFEVSKWDERGAG